jgi:hypothetical protein
MSITVGQKRRALAPPKDEPNPFPNFVGRGMEQDKIAIDIIINAFHEGIKPLLILVKGVGFICALFVNLLPCCFICS